jgi:hypothetical protein
MPCYSYIALQGFRKLVHEMKLEKQAILHDSAKQHERVQEYQREMLAMQARLWLPGVSDRGHAVLPGVLCAVRCLGLVCGVQDKMHAEATSENEALRDQAMQTTDAQRIEYALGRVVSAQAPRELGRGDTQAGTLGQVGR